MKMLAHALATAAGFALTATATAATFVVSNNSDDPVNPAPNTLRWAIQQSNQINRGATPTLNTILIQPGVYKPAGPLVLPLTEAGESAGGQFLPPLVGPVNVVGQGVVADPANPAQTPSVVIDGSNLLTPRTPTQCPGATYTFDFATGRWVATVISGTGPNVRGYYGAGIAVHDTRDVTISGMELRNFCGGVVSVRSSNVLVRNVKVVDAHGVAGVVFTGDNGNAGTTALAFDNALLDSVLLDNGDGFEFTRGVSNSTLQGNYIALTQPLPVSGNAVEFATSGNTNRVIRNVMTAYSSTAMTVGSGSGHVIEYNDISNNPTGAMTSSGAGNVIRYNRFVGNNSGPSVTGSNTLVEQNIIASNRGVGLNLSSATATGIRVTRNAIHGNTGLGIDITPTGVNANDPQDADTGGNGRQNFPVLDVSGSDWTAAAGIVLKGALNSTPNQTFTLELFASRTGDAGQGQVYLGSVAVKTDVNGDASFSFPAASSLQGRSRTRSEATPRLDNPFGDGTATAHFTATATSATGSTSEFGAPMMLVRR